MVDDSSALETPTVERARFACPRLAHSSQRSQKPLEFESRAWRLASSSNARGRGRPSIADIAVEHREVLIGDEPSQRVGAAVGLIAEVLGQLGRHRAFDQPPRQIGQQPARTQDLTAGVGEQLGDHAVGQLLTDLIGQLADRQPATGALDRVVDEFLARARSGPRRQGRARRR